MFNVVERALLPVLLLISLTHALYVTSNDIMKCSYGERGSLTATCVNANASYFKHTLYRFDQLDETLRCINCTLTSIDPGTFDISGNQIKNLDLTNSRIEKLNQKAFVGLIFLEDLVMKNNSIRSIYPGTFQGVKKIKNVDISNNEITILSDDGFLELVNLVSLNLAFNKIQTISNKAFNGLNKLITLNLQNNQISNLNNVFSNLTSLETLDLGNNKITTLKDKEFLNLTSLKSLNLAYNMLSNPVIEMIPQNNLTSLLLDHNNIETISKGFLTGLHNLETLDLSNNHIKEVNQQVLQSLFHLRNLFLSYNMLNYFQTGSFTGLPQLENLNVSHNAILEIQITGVFSIHNLHVLDISNNAIEEVDYVGLISRLPRLAYLRMENNKLSCDLEDEMETYFAEDNFKFVIYENVLNAPKCRDEPPKKSQVIVDSLITEAKPVSSTIGGAEVAIFVLISIQFACIGFLLYLQYQAHRNLTISSSRRTNSSVNLVSPDADPREGEFLRE